MVRENMTAKKERYISVRNDGEEMYVENISTTGRMRDHLPAVKLRLREIQRVMPLPLLWVISPITMSASLAL